MREALNHAKLAMLFRKEFAPARDALAPAIEQWPDAVEPRVILSHVEAVRLYEGAVNG